MITQKQQNKIVDTLHKLNGRQMTELLRQYIYQGTDFNKTALCHALNELGIARSISREAPAINDIRSNKERIEAVMIGGRYDCAYGRP